MSSVLRALVVEMDGGHLQNGIALRSNASSEKRVVYKFVITD